MAEIEIKVPPVGESITEVRLEILSVRSVVLSLQAQVIFWKMLHLQQSILRQKLIMRMN
jgi:hypothetical protein